MAGAVVMKLPLPASWYAPKPSIINPERNVWSRSCPSYVTPCTCSPHQLDIHMHSLTSTCIQLQSQHLSTTPDPPHPNPHPAGHPHTRSTSWLPSSARCVPLHSTARYDSLPLAHPHPPPPHPPRPPHAAAGIPPSPNCCANGMQALLLSAVDRTVLPAITAIMQVCLRPSAARCSSCVCSASVLAHAPWDVQTTATRHTTNGWCSADGACGRQSPPLSPSSTPSQTRSIGNPKP